MAACRVSAFMRLRAPEIKVKEPVQNPIDQFIGQYIAKPKGSSPESLADNVCKWLAVANDPKQFHPNADEFELRYRRRNARQSVRRILGKHPELVPVVAKLMEGKATEQAAEVRDVL
jgi:hypothetical protein